MSISIGGVPLAEPAGYRVGPGYLGAGTTLADGSIQFDLVNDNAKLRIELTWTAITTAQRNTINTAYNGLRKASAAFVGPDGTSVTVVRDPGQQQLLWEAVKAAGATIRWSGTLVLLEA